MQPPQDSVLQLLCKDLRLKSQHFQRLHLEAFEAQVENLWRVGVTGDDARLLLAVLLQILQTREASTVFQRRLNWLAAAAALRVLYVLYTTNHLHYPLFLDALKALLKEFLLDGDHLYQRMSEEELALEVGSRRLSTLAALPPITPQPAADEAASPAEARSRSLSFAPLPEPASPSPSLPPQSPLEPAAAGSGFAAAAAANAAPRSGSVKPAKKPMTPPQPEASAVDLPHEYLEPLKASFDDLDREGRGELGFTELLEFADKAGKELTMAAFKRLDKAGTGLVGFVEIVRSWYPKVALRELQRKVAALPSAAEMRRHKERAAIAAEFRKAAETRRRKEEEERAKYEEERQWVEHLQTRRRSEAIVSDTERQARWSDFRERAVQRDVARVAAQQVKGPEAINVGPVRLTPAHFILDAFLEEVTTRPVAAELLRAWDIAGIDVQPMSGPDGLLHLYVPHRRTRRAKVFRDYALCPPRPVASRPWAGQQHVHIKTNIPAKSDVMYRFAVEGYNYGVNAPINSDIIGYTHRRWNRLGTMEDFGWPDGWDSNTSNDYAAGARISQYISKDGFVVVLLNHDYGADFTITSTIHHDDTDL